MKTPEEIALHNCESEPIHIPGYVQSHGAIIGFDKADFTVNYKTDNLDSLIAQADPIELGQTFLEACTNKKLIHSVRNAMGLPTITTQRERLGVFDFGKQKHDVAVHIHEETVILEIEQLVSPADAPSDNISRVRGMLSQLNVYGELQDLLDSGVKALRELTGFDRVMGYRFLENGDGEVIAEARSPSVEPFLGLRYPAYDIPPQVRRVALKMPFRNIVDVQDTNASIIGRIEKPLDLTLTHLRGVSPIHLEYLTNMGVGSSMNISIIVRGELWGLFAFHHRRPKRLTPDHRGICELFGQLFSMQLQQDIERELIERRKRAQSTRLAFRHTESDSLVDVFGQLGEAIAESVRADGIALVQADDILTHGDTPSETFIRQLVSVSDDEMFVVDSFASMNQLPPGEPHKSAGAVVTSVDANRRVLIVYFRNEIIENVRWGGAPEKQVTLGPNGPRLSPRGSFGEYTESVTGKCEPWNQGDVSAALELRGVVLDLVFQDSERSKEVWSKQRNYQNLLVAELNHRVKNILALVRSISQQTSDSAVSLEAYVQSFEKRISALATAHDLIGSSGLQFASLEGLLTREIKPYLNTRQDITVAGDPIGLRPEVAPILALVFHELVSNSVKHGALSSNVGVLSIKWHRDAGGVALDWGESKLRGIQPPTHRGFGLTLIEQAIPYECGGKVSLSFKDDGLRVKIWLPSEAVTVPDQQPPKPQIVGNSKKLLGNLPVKAISESDTSLDQKSILIVEDKMVLALEMKRIFNNFGYDQVFAAPDSPTAVPVIESERLAMAVLDINLGQVTSFNLAIMLQKKKIPFVFVSGHDGNFDIPTELADVPRLTKPVDQADLERVVKKLTGGGV